MVLTAGSLPSEKQQDIYTVRLMVTTTAAMRMAHLALAKDAPEPGAA
jgi:hypothetical protein